MVYAVGQAFDGGAEAALLARGDLEFGVLDGVGINRDTKSTCHRDQKKLSRCDFVHWTLSSYHGATIPVGSDQRGCV